jgi:signal transduction histidine kinase
VVRRTTNTVNLPVEEAPSRTMTLVGAGGCLLAATVGALALLGWVIHQPRLYSWLGDSLAMKPFGALAAITLAGAVWAGRGGGTRSQARLAIAGAALVGALALAMLIESASGVKIGVDSLLFRSDVARYRLDGRMAENTALGMTLLSISALTVMSSRPRVHRLAQWFAFGGFLIALVGGLGRDEGPVTLLAYPGYGTLSASHTVSLTGLAAAVIALHPRLEINRLLFSSSTPAGRTLRTLLVPIGVIPLVAGVVAGNLDFTIAQARTAVWALFVGVAVLLATIVLVRSLAEMRREDDRLRLAEEADRASALARSGHVLEAMVDAADRERSVLATGLHDDTIQVMTAALLSIDRASAATRNGADATAALVAVRESLTNALERTRRLTFNLQPPVLAERGLQPALSQLARELGEQLGAEIEVDITASRFPPEVEQIAYRTARELMANARKHSSAHTISVKVEHLGVLLAGHVDDDGVGFDSRHPHLPPDHQHMGLDSTAQRLAAVGGTFHVDSSPNHGARVQFTIPCLPEP